MKENPNIPVIKKWVEALRSGRYRQGQGALRRDKQFCCLGVLCDLHRKELGGRWINPELQLPVGYRPEEGENYEEAFLPELVSNWAGIECDPLIDDDTCASELNDDGVKFKEIADLIEKKYLKKTKTKTK